MITQRLSFEKLFICFYYKTQNNLTLRVSFLDIQTIIFFFKYHMNLLYNQLIDISIIDYLEKKFRFEIFYNLRSIKYNTRLFLTSALAENLILSSITKLYPNANWYEREVWDMFGVYFTAHPDLRRILTDYGFKGHPLRKDFPMTGYIEVRYDAFLKRILYEEVSLTQKYRIFKLDSFWSTLT